MPEVTLAEVVNLDLIKMKWKEQYVSEGLNRKVAPGQPAGIYQGLRIIENLGANLQVEIAPDADTGYHMAVYQSTTGYSLTYWDLAGTATILNLNVAVLLGADVVIGLEMDYTVGVDTVAEWKAFPVTDWDALPLGRKNEIIVLGTVAVPGAGTITTAMISLERTTMAWRNLSKGAISWSPVLRNGDFEQAQVGSNNAWYWNFPIGADGQAIIRQADPFRNSLYMSVLALSANPVGVTATQNIGVPVTPTQLGMVKLYKKNIVIPAAGTMSLDLIFSDLDGVNLAALSVPIDMAAVDASYQEVLSVFEVPASATSLRKVVVTNNATYAGVGNKIYIDDINVWLETEGERNDLQHGVSGDLEVMGRLAMRDPAGLYSDQSLEINYVAGGNQLNINDQTNSGGLNVDVNGDLIASTVTADTAMAADQVTIGADIISTDANASLPRIILPVGIAAGIEYTLMWESVPAGSHGYRKYVSSSGEIVETVNASWDNTANEWTHDQSGSNATKTTKSISGMLVEKRTTTAGTWTDVQWDVNNVKSLGTTGDGILIDYDGVSNALSISMPASGGGTGTGILVDDNDSKSTSLVQINKTIGGTGDCIDVVNAGTGRGLDVTSSGIAGACVRATHSGGGSCIEVVQNSTGRGIYVDSNGAGDAIQVDNFSGIAFDVNHVSTGSVFDIDMIGGGTSPAIDLVSNQTGGTLLQMSGTSMVAGNMFTFNGENGHLFENLRYGRLRHIASASNTGAITQEQVSYASFASAAKQITTTRAASTGFQFIRCYASAGADSKFYVRGDGTIFADNGVVGTPGDYAEYMEVEANYATYSPGDVMVFSGNEKKFDKSTVASSAMVAGVYSTDPLVLGNNVPGCGEHNCDTTTGVLEVASWALIEENGDASETMYNRIVLAGDQTVNYAAGDHIRFEASGVSKILASSYDVGQNETTVDLVDGFPNGWDSVTHSLYRGMTSLNVIPLAMLGQVPVKCITENGTITPGDMLVTSSTTGRAMKVGASPTLGTILGKAMETLTDTGASADIGTILVYINLH